MFFKLCYVPKLYICIFLWSEYFPHQQQTGSSFLDTGAIVVPVFLGFFFFCKIHFIEVVYTCVCTGRSSKCS